MMSLTLSANDIKDFQHALFALSLPERLAYVQEKLGGRMAFSTSLGPEDQIVLDALLASSLDVKIFTLDTGRLFAQTYHLLAQMQKISGNRIEVYYPDTVALQEFASKRGIDSFYESVENRKSCCEIRKTEPLNRALQGVDIWITGLRASQSQNRASMPMIEWDETRNLLKFNPIIDWRYEAVWETIRHNQIPYNELHDQGFPSIGCAPCTRAVALGEDERSGRWWWEEADKKECGLHVSDGKIVRKSA